MSAVAAQHFVLANVFRACYALAPFRLGEKVSFECRYFLCSLPRDARQILAAVREHWGIENCVHRVLDVVFGEDACRIRSDNAPQNLATLRHLALNLLRRETTGEGSVKARQKRAGWDNDYLLKVIAN